VGDPPRLPATAPEKTLEGHSQSVLSVTFTKNGRYCMSTSQDKSIRLWNPHSGVHVKTYTGPHNQEVNDVAIWDDNSRFASGGGDKHVFLWDVTTAQVIRKFAGHDRKVNAVALGPEENVLLTASGDKTVRVWDLRTKSSNGGRGAIQVLDDAKDGVLCVCAAGDEIVAGSVDGALRRYDIRKGRIISDELLQPVGSVSFSDDGKCILVSTLDHTVRLMERDTGNELACYKGHTNQRFKVRSTLDPTNSYVVSGSEDNRVCFWDLVEGKMLASSKEHGGPVFGVEFFEDTMLTAGADGLIKVWKVPSAC